MREVYLLKYEGESEIVVMENGEADRIYRLKDGFLTGRVYVGKVKFVKKQAGIFVDVGQEKDGLLTYREGVKPGDLLLVQATREASEEKGCALTEKITLAGRYAVVNDVGEMRFSPKIPEDVKVRLFNAPVEDGIGFIFRSACAQAEASDVFTECRALAERLKALKASAKNKGGVTLLYGETAMDVATRLSPDGIVSEGDDETRRLIRSFGERKVEKEGVELVFDKTEAMTVVDVNMHAFSAQGKDPEDFAFRANVIAMKELARQIRLRNIGGIIMVDFISMKMPESEEKLQSILMEELKKDYVKTSVELVKSIGMFAIVRRVRYSSL